MHLNALLDRNVAVLTASRRLAHAIRAGVARHAQARGLAVWRTPTVLPWTAWLREQWREARVTSGSSQWLLSRAQARVLWRSIVADSKSGAHLLSPSNAARLAERSWRRLHEYSIAPEALVSSDQPESQALHEWCAAFAARCRELNAVDEAQLAAWAARTNLVPTQPLALAGFDHIPTALQRLTDVWRQAGKVAEIDAVAPASDVAVVGARDAAGEIESAARWARAMVEGGASVGVLVSNLARQQQEVRRAFEDVFAPGSRSIGVAASSAPIAIAAARPLIDYPLIDAAFSILQLADEGDSALLGRVLRSSFLGGGVGERDVRAVADIRLREAQRGEWRWSEIEHWGGAAAAPAFVHAAREIAALLRTEHAPTSPSRWVERFQRILRCAGWPGERTLGSAEQQTLLKFQSTLAEFGGLDVVLTRLSLRDALMHLQSVLRDTSFEPESPAASVTIIDPATAAGMSFDALWVMGLDADRWPAAANPDPLIPAALQRAAGMPEATAERMRALTERQLERWLRSARTVVFSWPQHEGDAELEPSPLLSRFASTSEVIGSAHVGPASAGQEAPRPFRHALFAHRPVLESLVDRQAPALAPGAAPGGARILELQSHCPFRAQAEMRLHSKEMPAVSVGIEPRDRGRIIHDVLKHVWGELKDHDALAASDRQDLALMVRAAAERVTAATLKVATGHRAHLARLEIESVTRQVLTLLDLERTRPPFRVRLAEEAELFQIGSLSITLRPDRIDELANHGALLIDYKLGDSHSAGKWLDRRPGRPESPQLPLYALAHEPALDALAFVTLAPGAVEYRGWSRSGVVGAGVPTYPPKRLKHAPPDFNALLSHWRWALTQLATQYVAGESGVDPLPRACDHCHLSTFCRIHEHARVENGDDA